MLHTHIEENAHLQVELTTKQISLFKLFSYWLSFQNCLSINLCLKCILQNVTWSTDRVIKGFRLGVFHLFSWTKHREQFSLEISKAGTSVIQKQKFGSSWFILSFSFLIPSTLKFEKKPLMLHLLNCFKSQEVHGQNTANGWHAISAFWSQPAGCPWWA